MNHEVVGPTSIIREKPAIMEPDAFAMIVHAIRLGSTMWVYAGVNLASFVFVFVPEAAGASLEDIEAALREGTFRPVRGRTAIAAAA